jgi:phosphoglycolate phosphatase-like HAD superfamily hydrolase
MTTLYAWDYHGTLAKNNELAMLRALNATFHELGIPRRANLTEVVDLYGKPWGDYLRHYLPDEPQERISELVKVVKSYAARFVPKHIKPMDHAHEVLTSIKERGDSNIIISNMTETGIAFFLQQTRFDGLIDHTIGIPREYEIHGHAVGFNTAEYKGRKLLEYAGSRFEKIVMTGDRESDIEAGKIAGVHKIYLFAPHQRSHVREDNVCMINDLREVLA